MFCITFTVSIGEIKIEIETQLECTVLFRMLPQQRYRRIHHFIRDQYATSGIQSWEIIVLAHVYWRKDKSVYFAGF